MASNDRGVPRGDNVAGEQEKADSVARQDANTRGEGVAAESARREATRDEPAVDERAPGQK